MACLGSPSPDRGYRLMAHATVVALLGAECTGKSTLAEQLTVHFSVQGLRCALVAEYLREFCERVGRTPFQHEQHAIAQEQSRRVRDAAQDHDLVFADTTALMTAVYSDWVFADTSLYASALADQAGYGLTLLTALDLPWQADGIQRDGPQVREPVDGKIRGALVQAGLAWSVVAGTGPARLNAAIAAVDRHLQGPPANSPRWRWVCAKCDDGDCEAHALALHHRGR